MIGNVLSAQAIISSMITPAFLILGAANLASIALSRLGRTVDRVRRLIDCTNPTPEPILCAWLDRYSRRARLCERAVLAFFIAVGIFVAACLSLALDYYMGGQVTWLPVGLTILGMLVMLAGATLLGYESNVARHQIHEEIGHRVTAA